MNKEKIIYYEDELNDEFSTAKIVPRVIDEKYKYIHKNPLWDFCSIIFQNVLSMPIKLIYAKLKFKIKYIRLTSMCLTRLRHCTQNLIILLFI